MLEILVIIEQSLTVGGIHVAVVEHDSSAVTIMSGIEQVNSGGLLSFTITLKEQVAVSPAPSVAV